MFIPPDKRLTRFAGKRQPSFASKVNYPRRETYSYRAVDLGRRERTVADISLAKFDRFQIVVASRSSRSGASGIGESMQSSRLPYPQFM